MMSAKLETGQIQKMFVIKSTGFVNTDVRKDQHGWLDTEGLEGVERRQPLGSCQTGNQPKQKQQKQIGCSDES